MDLIESNTHSFIIKVWLEEPDETTGRTRWRGHITHVTDGERVYVESFDHITSFIARYLGEITVERGSFPPEARWFHRLKLYLRRKLGL